MNWTCEGLKQLTELEDDFPLFGVNWTCEGLKQQLSSETVRARMSVNWTCEGLKQCCNLTYTPPLPVWIEPVRDWNEERTVIVFFSSFRVNWTCEGLKPLFAGHMLRLFKACELNLWGIETFLILQFHLHPQSVWIEPVRDWNFEALFKVVVEGLVWIEPVRDWN